ncbi:hypothetical protein MALG_02485 [Marinovum algicola DG 898]|nr:hypothetical protein MALG_02485 [Marinovum algicola DG 898]
MPIHTLDYPETTGLTSAFNLGVDDAASEVNQGSGADATAGSSVTYQTAYMEARGGNSNSLFAIQTTDQDDASADLTFCALFKRNDANFRQIIGAYNGVTNGAGLTTNGLSAGDGSALQTSIYPTKSTGAWQFHAGLITDGTLVAFTGYSGRLLIGDPADCTRVQSTKGARIGGALATSSTASMDIASVSKHTRALTEGQLLDMYRFMKERGERLGLMVG